MRFISVYREGEVVAETRVDDEDFDRFGHLRWYPDKDGYVRRAEWVVSLGKLVNVTLHRAILDLPKGEGRVDHRNGDRLDNRRSNLRVATHQANMHNRRRMSGRGSSQHRGVSWDAATQKWVASAMLNYQSHYLGRYDDEEEAGRVAHEFRLANMPDYEAMDR